MAELWLDRNVRERIDTVCLRETQRSLDFSVKRLLEQKIQHYQCNDYFEVQDRKITSRHGGVTIFEGMQNHTADSIKSLEAFDIAWFEEAQRSSQKSIDILRPTIRKPGSEMWFSWNPDQPEDPIEILRSAVPPDDCIVVQSSYLDNPFLPDELAVEARYDQNRDQDKYNHIWLGDFNRRSEARVFKNWTIEEFDRPAGTVYRFGADWGYAIDPSVLIRCSTEGNRLYIDYEAYMIGCEIINLPNLFDRVPESRKWFITADSSRPETIAHLNSHGYPRVNSAQKGAGSVEEGIQFLQSFDIVVHPRCKHTIQELTTYCYKSDPKTGEVIPYLEDKNNHCMDALRYACEGIRHAPARKKAKTNERARSWMAA